MEKEETANAIVNSIIFNDMLDAEERDEKGKEKIGEDTEDEKQIITQLEEVVGDLAGVGSPVVRSNWNSVSFDGDEVLINKRKGDLQRELLQLIEMDPDKLSSTDLFIKLACTAAQVGDDVLLPVLIEFHTQLNQKMSSSLIKQFTKLNDEEQKELRKLLIYKHQAELLVLHAELTPDEIPQLNRELKACLVRARREFILTRHERLAEKFFQDGEWQNHTGETMEEAKLEFERTIDEEIKSYEISNIKTKNDALIWKQERKKNLHQAEAKHMKLGKAKVPLSMRIETEQQNLGTQRQEGACKVLSEVKPDVDWGNLKSTDKYGRFLEALLGAGLSVNTSDPDTGDTLLHFAIRHRNPTIVSFLLDHNADTALCNKFGVSYIREITRSGNVDAALNFIQRGILFDDSIHTPDEKGNTLLHYAVQHEKYYPVAIYLIEKGMPLFEKNKKGETAWDYVSRTERTDRQRNFVSYLASVALRYESSEVQPLYQTYCSKSDEPIPDDDNLSTPDSLATEASEDDLWQRAHDHIRSGSKPAALPLLNQLLRTSPENTQYLLERGKILALLGRRMNALQDFNAALRVLRRDDKRRVQILIERGFTWEIMGITGNALRDYNEAIALDDTRYFAYFRRAVVYGDLGGKFMLLSQRDYEMCLGLNSTDPTVWMTRAEARMIKGEFEGALADFKAARATKKLWEGKEEAVEERIVYLEEKMKNQQATSGCTIS